MAGSTAKAGNNFTQVNNSGVGVTGLNRTSAGVAAGTAVGTNGFRKAYVEDESTDGVSTANTSLNESSVEGHIKNPKLAVNVNVAKAEDKLAIALVEQEIHDIKNSLKIMKSKIEKMESDADGHNQQLGTS